MIPASDDLDSSLTPGFSKLEGRLMKDVALILESWVVLFGVLKPLSAWLAARDLEKPQ